LNLVLNANSPKKEKSENPQILSLLAGILNELNDEKCVSLYKRVLDINPKFYLAYRGLGNFYLKNKNYPLAREYYSKAIEINPIRFGPIYKNLGVVLLNLGIESDARDSLREYLKHVPDAADRENILQFLNS
jgi:tetratricopeptide (TPR) repeat protein